MIGDSVKIKSPLSPGVPEKNSIDFRTCRKWGSAKKYNPTRAKTRVLKMQIMENQNLPQGISLKRRHLSSHRINWQFEIQT